MPAAAPLLLLLAILWWPLVSPLAPGHLQSPPTFISLNGSRLNHLLLDTHSGHVYVGAINVLYHLSPDLQLLSWGQTGPKLDSPDCLPPIDPTDCTQAETTDNTNKLLLLEEVKNGDPLSLIVCGTVLQGICEKRSLENVSQVLYKTDNPVDTQYVAANDPRVSTVGVVVEQKGVLLMLVGRGYTSKGPGGIPPITMRRLTPVARHSAPAFSHEELGKLVVGSYSEYNNHFVKAFRHNSYVYFVFSRRDVWGKREYRTYVSRLCAGDPNFYSYVEVPLSCGGGYNLAQAAVLGSHREQPALFVAMAMGQASTPTSTDRSALCVYKVEDLDKALHGAQLLCYTQEGKDANNKEKAYIEYEVSSSCLKLPQDSLNEYPCGGEHTPSPIASAIALEATPAFTWTPPITAVTTATEVGHTIVLLGDKNGRLHKVFLHANGTGTKYDTVEVDAESPINADLLLDSTKQNVYVLTERKVTKLHVAQCEKHLDCHSCLSNRDPYCGWCSLEGRCMACVSSMWPCHWCVKDELCTHDKSCPRQHVIYNSREQSLPRGPDSCPCVWALQSSPLVPVGFDTELSLQGKNLDIFEDEEDYACVLVIEGQELRLPATLDLSKETGTHVFKCAAHQFQYSEKQFEYSAPVYLQWGTQRIDSAPHLRLQLYDCSVGQSDCSQCRAVAANYGCVWCADETPGCVYNQSCTSGTMDTCPPPLITEVEPLTGPLEGGILLTIQGSNLGQNFQDIQEGVTVAGVTCSPLPAAYRISTSIVCELQASANVTAGPVVITVRGSEKGESQQTFSYQNPQLSRIVPEKGPLAGGTMLTVHGSQLLTGQRTEQRSDQITGLQAFLGSKPCRIDAVSDTQMICRTSHSNQTGRVPVRVVFGKAERILESVLFSYMEDPVITDATPAESFWGGGRLIQVTGQNLNVVQQPKMSVSYEPRERSEVRRRRHTRVSVRNPLVTIQELCTNVTSERMICKSPAVDPKSRIVRVWFEMDNVHIDFNTIKNKPFTYHPNPDLFQLNSESRGTPIRFKPGGVLAVEGKGLTLAMSREEVVARLGDKECDVKTLDSTHLYCEPPEEQPLALDDSDLPRLKRHVSSLNSLGAHRLTETVVEKMLTNWMSICLYSFLKEVAGEPLYKLYRAIKYQVDKGPVDAVTGKAKRTLNDSHLFREDIDYCSVTLTVLVKSGVEVQPCPVKVLDTDTITQVKDKILDQIYKGAAYSQRPAADSLDLEWRSGQAGHLTLSDDDVTAIVQGRWKRINTLQHYKVPDGATVALIPRSQSSLGVNQFYQTGRETPMLEGEEEEGLRLWHLVKPSEDPEIPKHRKSSMRERERAKAIPEIYLTRLLSMKGTLQKFVDDVFVAILSTKRPPPIAVRFFFDFLDDMAEKHGIDDPETVHIWKTNSLPLRFWVNILKNPQFVFDVQVTDSVDAVLSVIAQTFIDSCTTSEHKVGRDSPVNKLLYAREIPRYKQLVERYYSDIHNAVSGCYQEMNSTLTELSGSFASEMNSLVALHELYKYINKYYDQIIMSLEEDAAGQKMQLAYRLQQVAALVENKVTDL
ncbi:plexin-B3 [Garra rufa]|uniref:plexin-B3 n=1 Tax=Garra rufa TaxID=137080 RepID=UPI003CCE5B03